MKRILIYLLQKYLHLFTLSTNYFLSLIVLTNIVIVSWLPNSEPDLAGYKLYYGNVSRSYSNVINVNLTTSYTVDNLQSGYEYFFAVSAYDTASNESQLSEEVSIYISNDDDSVNVDDPKKIYNFPNPFNPEKQFTQIRYFLTKSEQVTIVIFDVTGNKIKTILKNVLKNLGEHIEDVWDGKDEQGNFVPNGIYYAHLHSESLVQYITIAVTR